MVFIGWNWRKQRNINRIKWNMMPWQELLTKIKTEKLHKESHTALDRPSVSIPTTLDHGHGSMTTFDPATWLNNLKSISVGDFEKTKSTRFKVKRMHYWKRIKPLIKNFLIEEENYMFYYRQRSYLYSQPLSFIPTWTVWDGTIWGEMMLVGVRPEKVSIT